MDAEAKKSFADEAGKCAEHPIVEMAINEAIENLVNNGVSMAGATFTVCKIANVVGQVARAQALGIDPDELV